MRVTSAIALVVATFCVALFSPRQADALTGSWSVLTPMSTARTDPFVAAVDGMLYVAGGNSGGAFPSSDVLERYDPDTDTWTTLASMPSGRYRGGVAVVGTDIYMIGGWNPPSTFVPTSTVQIYDTLTDTWSTGPSIPTLSASGPTGVIDGKIYKHTAEHGSSSASKQLHVLDPDTGIWSTLASIPNDHSAGAYGVINDIFYVASGTDFGYGSGGGDHAQVHAYDPISNTWSTLTTGPTPRSGVGSGVFDDNLLIAGGSTSGTELNVFEAYNATTDTWSTLPSTPLALSSSSGALIGNKFYVVGGQNGGTLSNALQVFTIPEPAAAVLMVLGISLVVTARRQR